MPTINLELPPDDDEPVECESVTQSDFDRSIALFERARQFSLEEIEVMAFRVGCRWDDLAGVTASSKAAKLAEWCAQRGKLGAFEDAINKAYGVSV